MRTQLITWFILIEMLAISHTVVCQPSSKSKKVKVYKATISVSTQESNIAGILQKVSDSTVYLLVGSTSRTIPANEINVIVIRRKGKVGRRVAIGSVVGAGLGGLIGFVVGTVECSGDGFCFVGEASLGLAIMGAGVGALTGLVFGTKRDETIVVGQNLVEFERNTALLHIYTMPDVDVPAR